MKEPYVTVEDSDGSRALVFHNEDEKHEIIYFTKNGKRFFSEEFDHESIELVEQAAIDWAKGKRPLVPDYV